MEFPPHTTIFRVWIMGWIPLLLLVCLLWTILCLLLSRFMHLFYWWHIWYLHHELSFIVALPNLRNTELWKMYIKTVQIIYVLIRGLDCTISSKKIDIVCVRKWSKSPRIKSRTQYHLKVLQSLWQPILLFLTFVVKSWTARYKFRGLEISLQCKLQMVIFFGFHQVCCSLQNVTSFICPSMNWSFAYI